MKKKQALRPEFFTTLPTVVREQQAKEQGLTGEEQSLVALSHHAGWIILREYIDSLVKDLDNGTEQSIAQGFSLEEIGRNAVVINLAKGVIKRILDKVDDATQVAEKSNGRER